MKALVIGAGGFIGHNLVKRLKGEGWGVVGVDLKYPTYEKTEADEFHLEDASKMIIRGNYDRIYQLAADMGGAGFIFSGENDADVLSNSLSINLNIAKQAVGKCGIFFFSSSACAYPDGVEGKESDAYPANPPYDYGWEKIISERIYQAYARNYGMNIRIARFQNCFGPNGTFEGGREKAPAAISRKIIEAGYMVEVWGDGEQIRPFVFIDELLDGVEWLMKSDIKEPVNIGPNKGIRINELIQKLIKISGKSPIVVKHIKG